MESAKEKAARLAAEASAKVETVETAANEIDSILSDAPGNANFSDLKIPEKFNVIGAVELVKFKDADIDLGGKFSKDTYIVSLSCPKKSIDGIKFETTILFITAKQWEAYGCNSVIFKGNYIKAELEMCISGVTGYQKAPEDDFLTEHENTYNAFVNCVEAVSDVLMMHFDTIGLSERMSDRVIANVARLRESRAALEAEAESIRQFDRR